MPEGAMSELVLGLVGFVRKASDESDDFRVQYVDIGKYVKSGVRCIEQICVHHRGSKSSTCTIFSIPDLVLAWWMQSPITHSYHNCSKIAHQSQCPFRHQDRLLHPLIAIPGSVQPQLLPQSVQPHPLLPETILPQCEFMYFKVSALNPQG